MAHIPFGRHHGWWWCPCRIACSTGARDAAQICRLVPGACRISVPGPVSWVSEKPWAPLFAQRPCWQLRHQLNDVLLEVWAFIVFSRDIGMEKLEQGLVVSEAGLLEVDEQTNGRDRIVVARLIGILRDSRKCLLYGSCQVGPRTGPARRPRQKTSWGDAKYVLLFWLLLGKIRTKR